MNPEASIAETEKSLYELHPRRIDIILILAASAVLLLAGLHLPVLTVKKIWKVNTFSIWSGIVRLREDGHIFLSALIFFFSIVFPVFKLSALVVIWFKKMSDLKRQVILHWLGLMGKWSMLDVFIVAILIVAVKLGALATATPEKGIYYFGASILLSMFATVSQNYLVWKNNKSEDF